MELPFLSLIAVAFLVGFIMGNISRPVPTNLTKAFKETFDIKEKTTITSPSRKKENDHFLEGISENENH
mgnify:CR=1 FL=1